MCKSCDHVSLYHAKYPAVTALASVAKKMDLLCAQAIVKAQPSASLHLVKPCPVVVGTLLMHGLSSLITLTAELFKDNKQEEICPFTAQLLLLEGTSYCQDISTVVNCGVSLSATDLLVRSQSLPSCRKKVMLVKHLKTAMPPANLSATISSVALTA